MSQEAPEAQFGHPTKTSREGGAKILLELIPKTGEDIVAIGHPEDEGDLFFPEDALHFGEDMEEAVRRITHDFLSCAVDSFYVGTVKSKVDMKGSWQLKIVAVAQIVGPQAPEDHTLVTFTESTMPAGLVGWTKQSLQKALGE